MVCECVTLCCGIILVEFICIIEMALEGYDVCSLEDDDYGNMFITQEPSKSNIGVQESDISDGVETMEVGNECGDGLIANPMYSDISDPEDDFVIPLYGRVNE